MKGRDVPPKKVSNPYPGYPCVHVSFEIGQYGEEQEFYEGTNGPVTPYLLLTSEPVEGSEADTVDMAIPYDQLEDVIAALIAARKLVPPAAAWKRKEDGNWDLLIPWEGM